MTKANTCSFNTFKTERSSEECVICLMDFTEDPNKLYCSECSVAVHEVCFNQTRKNNCVQCKRRIVVSRKQNRAPRIPKYIRVKPVVDHGQVKIIKTEFTASEYNPEYTHIKFSSVTPYVHNEENISVVGDFSPKYHENYYTMILFNHFKETFSHIKDFSLHTNKESFELFQVNLAEPHFNELNEIGLLQMNVSGGFCNGKFNGLIDFGVSPDHMWEYELNEEYESDEDSN